MLPKSVKVEAYQPLNKKLVPTKPRKAKELAWKLGTKYTYRYTLNGKDIGSETFTVKKTQQGKSTIYQWKSSLTLKAGATSVKSETSFALADNGRPISFEREYTGSQRAKLKADFANDQVKVSKKVFFTSKRTIKLPKNAMFFDNNLLTSFAGICSHLDFKAGETTRIQAFHPNSFRILTLTFEVAKKMEKVNGEDCYKCKVVELRNTFWVSQDGRFVKGTAATLVMQLTK